MSTPAIIVCTVNAACLKVMTASLNVYVPREVKKYVHHKVGANFGDAYNFAAREAFKRHDEILICNDDIVFTPTTWRVLLEDVAHLRKVVPDLGYVATRSDYARGEQNVRSGRGKIDFLRYQSERHIVETPVIAPICAWVHRNAWVDFPPINWFSDDVQCADMKRRHFISRAYVHHVGSQTCGENAQQCYQDAEPWLLANRPELHARFYFTSRA